jgi:hypothetical protein
MVVLHNNSNLLTIINNRNKTKMKKPYLCGPIKDCNDAECKDWREDAKRKFPEAIDPLRRDYRGVTNEALPIKTIVEDDKLDIMMSDCLLVSFSKPSVGTSMEIIFAWEQHKPVIVVAPENELLSPWLLYHAAHVVHTFETAYKIIELL